VRDLGEMLVENDGQEMIRILFKCTDGFVRESVSLVLSTCVN